ncbi:hypothetical protein [Deinococcus sonorensis]|uniref:Uncharacterized protein n=2 Tax=Deinococcus sonorensis TaxID=309891 RepID=A0AAU7U5V4_9DEIO
MSGSTGALRRLIGQPRAASWPEVNREHGREGDLKIAHRWARHAA